MSEPLPGFALVRALAPLVPAWRRAEWLAEWEGELAWARDDARRRGISPRRTAIRLTFRSCGAATDAFWLRRHDGAPAMLSLDFKYALRSLLRRPGFTCIAILTLALGIGATTAIFSVVNGVLLRPLALPEPERIVTLQGVPVDGVPDERVSSATSYPDYVDIRARAGSFAELAALRAWQVTLTAPGAEPARLGDAYVTDNYFRALGTTPLLGRAFTPEDVRKGAAGVVVLSHALWRTRFNGDPRILGRDIALDGIPCTVVGVMPADLPLSRGVDLWRPLIPDVLEGVRGAHRLTVIGRLRAGVPLERAQAEVATIARALEQQYPADNVKRSARLTVLQENLVAPIKPALLVLLAAVVLVLVVGCANLAGLLLARAATREREMAVRSALGAGRSQILRQWMTESLLLTTVGGAAGAAVAWIGMRALLAVAPRTIPRADEVSIDGRVLAFLVAVSVVTGLVFGALPAFQGRRDSAPTETLRDARAATGTRARRRLRHALVAGEIALATVLVSGAGLLLQGLWRLTHTDLHFQPAGLAVVKLELPETRWGGWRPVEFYDRLRAEVARLPGVRSVAVAYETPIEAGWTSSYWIGSQPKPIPGQEPEASVRPVTPGYFRTVGVRILRGRDIAETDRMDRPGVAVVNLAFARRHFGTANPLGQTIERGQSWWKGQPQSFEIVGVVDDEPFAGAGAPTPPAIYYAHAQFPMGDMSLLVRHDGGEASVATLDPVVRRAVWSIDRDMPVEPLRPMPALVAETSAEPRFNAMLLTLFAAAALLLAAVGIYGVLSYTVAQRAGEIGVRIALGAERGRVVRQVVGEGVGLAAIGLVIGVPAALAGGRVLSSALAGVDATNPMVLGAVATTLLVVACSAAWLPAWRASRVDPVTALRAD